jgi:hypothetical protein
MNAVDAFRRRPVWSFVLGSAVVFLLLYADPILRPRTFAGRDLVPFFLPIEKAVHESWRHGRVPLWMTEVSFGRSLAANPNTGAFYPVRVAMTALPFSLAFKLFAVLHLWIAAVGVFLLARSLRMSDWAAVLAAAIYSGSGVAVSEIQFPDFVAGLALLPWVLCAAIRFARSRTGKTAALFALAAGFDVLAGDVFTLGLALYGSLLLVWQETPRAGRGRATAGLVAAGALGGLIAGIQVVPALLFSPLTVRALGRFPLGLTLAWSVAPARLLELVVPFPFGNAGAHQPIWGEALWTGKAAGFFQTLYAGAFACCALLLWRLARANRRFLVPFFATCLALAMAGFYFEDRVQGLSSPVPLRFPEKFMAGAVLVLALVSGQVADAFRGEGARRAARVPAIVAAALAAAALAIRGYPSEVAAFVNGHWSPRLHHGAAAAAILPPELLQFAGRFAVLAGILRLWTPRRGRVLLPLVLVLVVFDLDSVRRSFVGTTPESLVFTPSSTIRAIEKRTPRGLFGVIPMEDYFGGPADLEARKARNLFVPDVDAVRKYLGGFTAAAFGVRYSFNIDYDISDFYRVELARREFTRDHGRWPGVDRYLAAFSARFAVAPGGRMPSGFHRPAAALKPFWLVANDKAKPTIRFAREVREVEGVAQAYDLIHGRKVDLSRVDVVESGRRALTSGSAGRVTIEKMLPDRLELKTDTPGPARLVLARAYSPFRTITRDGRPVDGDPTDLCLTSIPVPAGVHSIRLRERLPGGWTGPLLSLFGLAVAALLVLRSPRIG